MDIQAAKTATAQEGRMARFYAGWGDYRRADAWVKSAPCQLLQAGAAEASAGALKSGGTGAYFNPQRRTHMVFGLRGWRETRKPELPSLHADP